MISAPEKGKQPYEKPIIEKIDLAADEVMVGGCKTATTIGAPRPPSCPVGGCRGAGS